MSEEKTEIRTTCFVPYKKSLHRVGDVCSEGERGFYTRRIVGICSDAHGKTWAQCDITVKRWLKTKADEEEELRAQRLLKTLFGGDRPRAPVRMSLDGPNLFPRGRSTS